MNIPLFIAKRVAFSKKSTYSKLIIRLSIIATIISVMSMIICVSFVRGFQETITNKMWQFTGSMVIKPYQYFKSKVVNENNYFYRNDSVEMALKKQTPISAYLVYAEKNALLKNENEMEGGIFKGIDLKSNNEFKKFITKGNWFTKLDGNLNKEIVISEKMASKLSVTVNHTIEIIFLDLNAQNTIVRKLKVIGFFKTNIEEIDNNILLGDIRFIQFINGDDSNKISGYQIFIPQLDSIPTIKEQLLNQLPIAFQVLTIFDIFPALFDWLDIQNLNKKILYIIMIIVAIINMITCIIVLIIERIKMIGILKALGLAQINIQKIFLYEAMIIFFIGSIIGVILGLLFCWLQIKFGFIKLDETIYYISKAPVVINGWDILKIVFFTCIVCLLSIMLPTLIIKKIKPNEAILFG